MLLRSALSALVLGACLPLMAAEASAQTVSLADLEASALANRAERGVGEARVAHAGAQHDRAESGYYPSLVAGVNATLAPGRKLITLRQSNGDEYLVTGARTLGEGSSAFVPQPRYGATLGLRGSLYDFGRTRSALLAADAQRAAAHAEAGAQAEQIVREVRGAYVRWAGAFALWKLSSDAVTQAEAHEKSIAALIEEGARPSFDRATAAQQVAVSRIEAERSAEQLEAARIDLAFVAARDLNANAEPDLSLLTAGGGQPTAAGEPASDPGSDALERAQDAADARARMQEHAAAPVLGYDADAGLQAQSTHVFPVYSVGLSLTVPLLDGGATSANAAMARAEARELAAQSAAHRAKAKHVADRTRAATQHATRRLELASESLKWAETQVAQLQGNTSLDPETQAALTNAEAARAKARVEVVLAQVACAQARMGLVEP